MIPFITKSKVLMLVCVSACTCTMGAEACRSQRRALDPLELTLQKVVATTWMLGIKSQCSYNAELSCQLHPPLKNLCKRPEVDMKTNSMPGV